MSKGFQKVRHFDPWYEMRPLFNLTGNSNCLTSSQNPSKSGSMDTPGPYQPTFLSWLRPSSLGVPFQNLAGYWIFLSFSRNPTIWVSMNYPGLKQPRFNIFELTQALQRVLGSHFKYRGKFKFVWLFHLTQQYWCLLTPMDPSNPALCNANKS